MDQNLTTLVAAGLAGAVGLAGYLVSQHWNRRERKAQVFAQALRAMYDYQHYPNLIYRRESGSPETRRRLAEQGVLTAGTVRYFLVILDIEAPLAARAFHLLLEHSKDRRKLFVHWAWQQSPMISDATMTPNTPFWYDYDRHFDLCIRCMRSELSFLHLGNRRLRVELDAAKRARESERQPTLDLITDRRAELEAEIRSYSSDS